MAARRVILPVETAWREISLSGGRAVAIVDECDFEFLSQWSWHSTQPGGSKDPTYAARWVIVNGKQKRVYMHKQLLGAIDGFVIDHINRNSLDNRKANLRHCTNNQNSLNRPPIPRAIVPYRGVQKLNRGGWQAKIRHSGKKHCLGSYSTPEEAARVYDAAALAHHGVFAVLNFPNGGSQ